MHFAMLESVANVFPFCQAQELLVRDLPSLTEVSAASPHITSQLTWSRCVNLTGGKGKYTFGFTYGTPQRSYERSHCFPWSQCN